MRFVYRFELIHRTLEKFSLGDFDTEIPQMKDDYLGDLSFFLSNIKSKLKQLIEEEKRAVQSKNELVTNVSHDLRTPLTSIIGYLRLIQDDQYKDEVELKYFVDIAYEKTLRLNKMVNDLFEFTKINNRDIAIRKMHFSLIEFLKQLKEQFLPQLREAEMELVINQDNEELFIYADPDKLYRVFENLITNAIKYGKTGKRIDIQVESEEEYINIHVINYGEPIPANAIPHIFERLYRLEKSRSDETGGTGLGLAIAKGIVELHQGEIHVYSNDLETRFEVKIPIAESLEN